MSFFFQSRESDLSCPANQYLYAMTVHDKEFELFIEPAQVQERVQALGAQISRDYEGKNPLLLGILNGAFIFMGDLAKSISIPCECSFVKYRSYDATQSTGKVNELIGLNEGIEGRHVIVVEDIVDTGLTMSKLISSLEAHKPASVAIASCLLKPTALKCEINIKYLAFSVDNVFVLGYGMDYNEQGRNLAGIYRLKP